MTHLYARGTYDEAMELARLAFRTSAADHLTPAEIDEIVAHGLLAGGPPGPGRERVIGVPIERHFYELLIYKPSDNKPYIEGSYVRILVPRDIEVVGLIALTVVLVAVGCCNYFGAGSCSQQIIHAEPAARVGLIPE